MKPSTFLAIAPFLSVATAAPLKEKRDIVWQTVTDQVVVTQVVVKTIWVAPGEASPSAAPSPAPAPPSQPAPVPVWPTPTPAASTSSGFAGIQLPTTLNTPQAAPPSPSPAPAPSPEPSSSPAPAPAPSPVQSSAPSPPQGGSVPVASLLGSTHVDGPCTPESPCTGDMTHYDLTAAGSCGYKDWASQSIWTNTDFAVALPKQIMGSAGNNGVEATNPLCNRQIHITHPTSGKSQVATVVDTCGGCLADFDVDMSPALFEALGGGDGRVHGMTWYYV